jgi:hypothetical protein
MTKDEALKMAIEALNKLARLGNGDSYGNSDGNCIAIKTLKAIEEALEAEQVCQSQEPFVWWRTSRDITDEYYTEYTEDGNKPIDNGWQPLYTHPAQPWQGNKEFVGLTADELEDIKDNSKEGWYQLVRNVEQALKEKNT